VSHSVGVVFSETTVLLQKNVQAVLQNVEETEKLEAKTEDMMKSAEQFKKTAREVKCAFCYNYWMWWVIGFCVILALFFILYFSLRKPSND
jgi:type II secretory pathway component PulF